MIASSPKDDKNDLSDLSASDSTPIEDGSDDAETADGELVEDQKVERFANLVVARVENKLEQHLHTQIELPPVEQAAALREKAPEMYETWVHIARQKADTEAFVQRAQYEVPAKLARTGRPWALVALFSVLGFCAYIASLGGSAIYVAGIIAAIDLFTMLGLFMGLTPELLNDRKGGPKGDDLDPAAKELPEDEGSGSGALKQLDQLPRGWMASQKQDTRES